VCHWRAVKKILAQCVQLNDDFIMMLNRVSEPREVVFCSTKISLII